MATLGDNRDSNSEPRAKIPKKEAANEELPDLLSTQPKHILVHIVNYLNPAALRELAFSSKFLFNFCLNTDEIDIVFPIMYLDLEEDNASAIKLDYDCDCDRNTINHTTFERCLEKLQRWPFSIHIHEMCFDYMMPLWEASLLRIKDYFVQNGVKKINSLRNAPIPSNPQNAEIFSTEFVQHFRIKCVEFRFKSKMSKETAKVLLRMPVKKLTNYLNRGDLDGEALANCSIPDLCVEKDLNMAGFRTAMEIWGASNFETWKFLPGFSTTEFLNFFTPFEIRTFEYTGPINLSNPPVFLRIEDHDDRMCAMAVYILREDRKIFCVTINPDLDEEWSCLVLRMCPIDEAPLALRNI